MHTEKPGYLSRSMRNIGEPVVRYCISLFFCNFLKLGLLNDKTILLKRRRTCQLNRYSSYLRGKTLRYWKMLDIFFCQAVMSEALFEFIDAVFRLPCASIA